MPSNRQHDPYKRSKDNMHVHAIILRSRCTKIDEIADDLLMVAKKDDVRDSLFKIKEIAYGMTEILEAYDQ